MYTINIYNCQLTWDSEPQARLSQTPSRSGLAAQRKEPCFLSPCRESIVHAGRQKRHGFGDRRSRHPTAPVSHIFYLTAHAIFWRSTMQLSMLFEAAFAPEMTRTSDLRFRKTRLIGVDVCLSATHC
jgi:hypothetical protein